MPRKNRESSKMPCPNEKAVSNRLLQPRLLSLGDLHRGVFMVVRMSTSKYIYLLSLCCYIILRIVASFLNTMNE